ncbi:hypothetical protein PHSY_006384 [Pseudozyma hubeiensis SY62]|uniref:Uncharacterized protein n=1 Tax=Pseudozyma hubeiensis (strain SY62) TaxID=1305764 RepID=R9PBR5_PSEHS|nr:hypothetical protein PHSY_006384 [Pseudozyma hubeiensis SY62]GAC98789.1 hypothetical protein PHSY_006384 [Pseudozyma hubeiensis SY62]
MRSDATRRNKMRGKEIKGKAIEKKERYRDVQKATQMHPRTTMRRRTGGTIDIDQTQACDHPPSTHIVSEVASTLLRLDLRWPRW